MHKSHNGGKIISDVAFLFPCITYDPDEFEVVWCPKGQIVLKGPFGVLECSQKTNERIRHGSKNIFVPSFFLGGLDGTKSPFKII